MSDQKLSLGFKVKRSVVSTSLLALGVAFEMVSKGDDDLKRELVDWEEGKVFSLAVFPDGPSVTMKKQDGRIHYLGKGIKENPTLIIYFKNLDCALLPFTGQMGSHTAFAQHRAILHGPVKDAMQISRAMATVQKYLMPGFIFKTLFKRAPKMSGKQLLLKAKVMTLIGAGLALNASK